MAAIGDLEIPAEETTTLEMERLWCLEEVDTVQPAPQRAFRHETSLNDTGVLNNLLAREDAYMPSGSYFEFQEEVRPDMRTELTKWMMEVRTLGSPCVFHWKMRVFPIRRFPLPRGSVRLRVRG